MMFRPYTTYLKIGLAICLFSLSVKLYVYIYLDDFKEYKMFLGKENIVRNETLQMIDNGANMLKSDAFKRKHLYANYVFNDFKRHSHVNCAALFRNDTDEMTRSVSYANKYHVKTLEPQDYIKMTANCSYFVHKRGYVMSSLTEEEDNFPIAYSIVMYKDLAQCERLLRALYRPQHVFCIHVDKKSNRLIYEGMRRIASCFDNVFVCSKRVAVTWGHFTVLEADVICMRELWNSSVSWNYLINLTGQEFPLRTNYELVQVLKAYKGANEVKGTYNRRYKHRWEDALPAPHNLTIVKGSVHVILSRGFVDFMLHDQRALDLLEWSKNTRIPDELYFNTLNHNPFLNVPGSYLGDISRNERDVKNPFVARYKVWWGKSKCNGLFRKKICIFSSRDLPALASRRELFANKFYWDYQHALDCMEELIFNRTRDEYAGRTSFNATWYSTLEFVSNSFH